MVRVALIAPELLRRPPGDVGPNWMLRLADLYWASRLAAAARRLSPWLDRLGDEPLGTAMKRSLARLIIPPSGSSASS